MTSAALANQTVDARVRVRVVYLARLREALDVAEEALVLSGTPNVRDVVETLRARGGAFARELAPGRAFRVALNHALASPERPLHDGDEVAFLPPVTGG
ncbi:MAG TPA: MoaD/ThiS family protein [Casimicrobiaceae bacterium]|jgi:molybdopterin synthase sulfur carrier subunit